MGIVWPIVPRQDNPYFTAHLGCLDRSAPTTIGQPLNGLEALFDLEITSPEHCDGESDELGTVAGLFANERAESLGTATRIPGLAIFPRFEVLCFVTDSSELLSKQKHGDRLPRAYPIPCRENCQVAAQKSPKGGEKNHPFGVLQYFPD